MKQKFFTLLLGLAMVSLGAVAQKVTVTMNSLGTRTFVCDQNLDFSSLNAVDKNLVPFYISGYSEATNSFSLTRFDDDRVPAYTPMILMVAYPDKWDGSSFEVDTYSATNTALNKARSVASANSKYFYMVPVITGTYTDDDGEDVYAFLPDTERAKIAGGKYAAKRSLTITTGYRTVKAPVNVVTIDQKPGAIRTGLYVDGYIVAGDVTSGGTPVTGTNLGDYLILHANKSGMAKEIWGMFEWSWSEEESTYYWAAYGSERTQDANDNLWDPETSSWVMKTYVPQTITYTQFILGRNGTKAEFRRCSDGAQGNPVNVGGCFVRVNSDLAPAASREAIGFEFADDNEDIGIGDVSGIKTLKNTNQKKEIFNMNGQKLNKMQKGLNIVNGKKLYVK